MSNRAAVLHSPGVVVLEDRQIPVPTGRQVLVKVASVGVCGSDVHFYDHGHIGEVVVESPVILGHEASGVVVGVGSEASSRSVGERVALEPGVPCDRCEQCRRGAYNLCPDVVFFATPPVDGAFVQYVVIDEGFAHPIPDSVSDNAAAMIEPFSVGIWAVQVSALGIGDRVLVTGAGPVGVLTALAAQIAGAAHVTITDVNENRLEFARRAGIDAAIDTRSTSATENGDFDVLFECSGVPAVAADAVRAVRPGGCAVMVGIAPDTTYPFPIGFIQNREITVKGTYRYANTYPVAIRLLASGRVDLDSLVTGEFPLDRTEAALRVSRTDPTAMKSVVLPNG